MTIGFIVLCAVIGAYWFITDSSRVRDMAQRYLTDLVGGPVTVEEATLSIFEGLRLDKVRVYVDESKSSESQIFTASSFIIEYSPRALLAGRIEATRIIAIEPRVYLVEDVAQQTWNYQRLRHAGSRSATSSMPNISVLPEILLRNAQVEYSRYQDQRRIERGFITIEGQLNPLGDMRYAFQFQSLGQSQGTGPVVRGSVALTNWQFNAELRNFEFGEDIKAMLPAPVLQWCEQRQLAGSLDVEELAFLPGPGRADPAFKAKIRVQGVKLTVSPEEWMGGDEIDSLQALRGALRVMRVSGLNSRGVVDRIAYLSEPAPIQLKDVYAIFTFTQDGVRIEDLTGKLEDIAFKIDGQIDGYSPSATADVTIASLQTRNVEIPASPRYVTSMPGPVREVYERFRPRGTCSFWLNLKRPLPGARPRVTGEINIIDGRFVFEKFPYPLRNATGKIVLAWDESTGSESLRLEKIRGRGVEGGPNANASVEINGQMGPFTPEIGVDVIVSGTDVQSEPLLTAAFPPQTQEALKIFDAPGKGEFPRFRGNFDCRITRLRQRESRWDIQTDIKLQDASGILAAFPYPMSGVSGDLKIRDDHLEIVNATMRRGDAVLRLDGSVAWGRDPSDRPKAPHEPRESPQPARNAPESPRMPSMRPNLKISARNVPIDRDLLNALPSDRRVWLERLGARGTFDLEGTLNVAAKSGNPSGELGFDFKIALRDGSLWPEGGTFAVSDVNGALRLTPEQLVISNLSARRQVARINGSGSVSWRDNVPPQLELLIDARELMLDAALYQLLPDGARRGWDEVQPEGTVDLAFSYSGQVAGAAQGPANQPAGDRQPAAPTTRPHDVPPGFELIITPRKLSATPAAVPYRLEDLRGTITVHPERVTVKDVTARHGDATIKIVASGSTARDAVWDFQISGDDVPVDSDLRRAVPEALAELLESLEMKGSIDFEFSKLRVSTPPSATADATSRRDAAPAPLVKSNDARRSKRSPTTNRDDAADVDFAVKISTQGASLQVGVPLADVHSTAELTGSSRNGKLHELSGKLHAGSLTLAGRPATDFRATLFKPPEHQAIQINRMEVKVAGGTMAGQVDYAFPDDAASRYAVALVLRNADVKQMTGQMDQDIRGQLTASLNLEGTYDEPGSRRGRGDVTVSGQQLYKIPLVLGLLQVTQLALPITGPFREGSARYSIDGQRVTFEQIELRSKEMLMQGDGWLDFGKKKVRMTFVTDARGWPKLPLIGDLMQGARNELLQIHVRGTLQEPKVSASSLNTFSTTIDEVFKGDEREASRD